jgi:hypothetical protein
LIQINFLPIWKEYVAITMKPFRRRQIRTRFALLAIVGLLWSQLVLAAHPVCSTAAMAMSELAMVKASAEGGCHHEETPSADRTLCVAHCSQSDQTNDVARVPVIPALPPMVCATIVSFVFLSVNLAHHPALPPPVSWHRPTAHPAAVLLI